MNPPFGHKASLANAFIKKALEFKPKILILIVPSETKRYIANTVSFSDKHFITLGSSTFRVDLIADYELIWEDRNLLSGLVRICTNDSNSHLFYE